MATPILTNGLLAYWKLDNNGSGGVSLVDSTGNGYTLTNNGGVTLGTGILNGCAVFNPANSTYLQIAANNIFNFSGDFSVQAWVKSAGQTRNYPVIFSSKAGWYTNSVKLDFFYTSNQAIGYEHNGSGSSGIRNNTNATIGVWYHVVIARQSGVSTLYINGATVASQIDTTLAAFNNSNTGTVIGGGNWDGYYSYFNGSLCEIGVWNRALLPMEINTLYNAGSGTPLSAFYFATQNYLNNNTKPRIDVQRAIVSTQALSAYWKMDETSGTRYDYSGNGYNLSVTEGTDSYGKGIRGNAALFDGSTVMTTPFASKFAFGYNDFSFSLWIYPTQAPQNNQTVFTTLTWPNQNGIDLQVTNTSINAFQGDLTNQINYDHSGFNKWYHVAITRKNGTGYLYINGNLIGSANWNNNHNIGLTYIGRPDDIDYYKYFGLLDEFAIWGRTLSQAEITQLYNNGRSNPLLSSASNAIIKSSTTLTLVTGGLVFEVNALNYTAANTTLYDDVSALPGTAINGNAIVTSSGSKAIYLNGQYQCFNFPYSSSLDLINNFTLEAWANFQSFNYFGGIFSFANEDNGEQYALSIWGTGQIYFGSYPYSGFVISSATLSLNTWYHIAVTYTNGTVQFFINGVPQATQSLATIQRIANAYLSIGNNHYGGQEYVNAYLPLQRIYNRVLTSNEIANNYNLGFGKKNCIYVNTTLVPQASSLLAYWRMNEDNGTRYDASGNGYNTIVTGGSVGSATGKIDKAANITNGNSAWLTLPAGVCDVGANRKSFSLWFKLNSSNVGYQWIGPMQGTGADYTELNVLYIETNSTLNCLWTGTVNHWALNLGNNIVPNANQWYHYVLTFGDNVAKAYLNGSLIATISNVGTILSSNSKYTLGHYNAFPNGIGGQPGIFAGQIDEVGIWSATLSQSDVTSLYNSGAAKLLPSGASSYGNMLASNAISKPTIKTNTNALVTDGSILILDASAHTAGSSVWIDRSGQGNNFNINSGAFNATGNYMDFTGNYGIAKNSANITLAGEVTYICVTRIKNYYYDWRTLTRSYNSPSRDDGNHHVIVRTYSYNIGMYNNYNGAGFQDSGYSQTSLPSYANGFDVLSWRWSSTGNYPSWQMDVNGVPNVANISSSNIYARYVTGFGSLGGYHNDDTYVNNASQFWGYIKYFIAYNRRLSDTEILQNYNYLKIRYSTN